MVHKFPFYTYLLIKYIYKILSYTYTESDITNFDVINFKVQMYGKNFQKIKTFYHFVIFDSFLNVNPRYQNDNVFLYTYY